MRTFLHEQRALLALLALSFTIFAVIATDPHRPGAEAAPSQVQTIK